MRRIADFIVEHSKLLLVLFLVLTVICAVCSRMVTTNTDMTKYLPDDSPMKQGMDIMEEDIHTIMTSGSILVIVTGVLGQYFPDPSTAQICQNISIGALCASLLILFILPGILVTVDRFIVRKERNVEVSTLSKKLAIIVNEKNACVLLRLQRRIHAAKQHTSYVYPCASIIVNACILCVYYKQSKEKGKKVS